MLTLLEEQHLESFLEIFLLVSESFRVIFRYNTRPPCLHLPKKERCKLSNEIDAADADTISDRGC